jgi:hypothetical protein
MNLGFSVPREEWEHIPKSGIEFPRGHQMQDFKMIFEGEVDDEEFVEVDL